MIAINWFNIYIIIGIVLSTYSMIRYNIKKDSIVSRIPVMKNNINEIIILWLAYILIFFAWPFVFFIKIRRIIENRRK